VWDRYDFAYQYFSNVIHGCNRNLNFDHKINRGEKAVLIDCQSYKFELVWNYGSKKYQILSNSVVSNSV
jgi:hypothetical protein